MTDLQTINGRKSWGPRRFLLGEVLDRLETVQREFEVLLAARAEDERIRTETNVDLHQTLRAMRAAVAEVQQGSMSIGEKAGAAIAESLRQEFASTLSRALAENEARFEARMEAFSVQLASVSAEQVVVHNEIAALAAALGALPALSAQIEALSDCQSSLSAQSRSSADEVAGELRALADAQGIQGERLAAEMSAVANGHALLAERLEVQSREATEVAAAARTALEAEMRSLADAVAEVAKRVEAGTERVAGQLAAEQDAERLEAVRVALEALGAQVSTLSGGLAAMSLDPMAAEVAALTGTLSGQLGGIKTLIASRGNEEIEVQLRSVTAELSSLQAHLRANDAADRVLQTLQPMREELLAVQPSLKAEIARVEQALGEVMGAVRSNAPVVFDVTKIDATWSTVAALQQRLDDAILAMQSRESAAPAAAPGDLTETLEGLRVLQATLVARLQEFKATLESNPLKQQASDIVEEFRKTAGDTSTVINKRMAEVERALISGVSSIGGNLEDFRNEAAQRDQIILGHFEQGAAALPKPSVRGRLK